MHSSCHESVLCMLMDMMEFDAQYAKAQTKRWKPSIDGRERD